MRITLFARNTARVFDAQASQNVSNFKSTLKINVPLENVPAKKWSCSVLSYSKFVLCASWTDPARANFVTFSDLDITGAYPHAGLRLFPAFSDLVVAAICVPLFSHTQTPCSQHLPLPFCRMSSRSRKGRFDDQNVPANHHKPSPSFGRSREHLK
jgi:hypothetical protein